MEDDGARDCCGDSSAFKLARNSLSSASACSSRPIGDFDGGCCEALEGVDDCLGIWDSSFWGEDFHHQPIFVDKSNQNVKAKKSKQD